MITGDQLRAQRIRMGLKPDQVAEMFGVNRKTVANWEAGQVPSTREKDVRREIFHDSSRGIVDTFSDMEIVAEMMELMTEMARRLARAQRTVIPTVDEQDQWFGATGPAGYVAGGDEDGPS